MFKEYKVVTRKEADNMVEQIKDLDWEAGLARTKELTGTIKQNLELSREKNPIANSFSNILSRNIADHKEMGLDIMVNKISGVKFNRYESGGTYNRHTDSPLMKDVRTDFACTIFLSDPRSYEGGELCIEYPNKIYKTKGKKGYCAVYECGRPHWVTPVTKGVRICGFTWIQSFIRDPRQRLVLVNIKDIAFEAEQNIDYDNEECMNRKLFVDAGTIHAELMRMWCN